MKSLYSEEKRFGFLMAAIILALLFFRFYKVDQLSIPLAVVVLLFSLTALLYPKVLYYPLKGWIKVGEFLGMINSYILLTLIFFLILVPMGVIRRLFKGDTLHLKENRASSCWHTSDPTKNRFDLQF